MFTQSEHVLEPGTGLSNGVKPREWCSSFCAATAQRDKQPRLFQDFGHHALGDRLALLRHRQPDVVGRVAEGVVPGEELAGTIEVGEIRPVSEEPGGAVDFDR